MLTRARTRGVENRASYFEAESEGEGWGREVVLNRRCTYGCGLRVSCLRVQIGLRGYALID